MSSQRVRHLRWEATCAECGCRLPAGSEGTWNRDSHTATCLECLIDRPADPFAGIDPELQGTAGASPRAEYDRRASKPNRNPRYTEPWKKGSDGESHLSGILQGESARGQFTVLDSRRIPGPRRDIDHIAVARSGVYVIDAKNYSGRVGRGTEGVWPNCTHHLTVRDRPQRKAVPGVLEQVEEVRGVLDRFPENASVPIIPVLCFVAADNWGPLRLPFTVDHVQVMWPRALVNILRADGPLSAQRRDRLSRLLGHLLPPARGPEVQSGNG